MALNYNVSRLVGPLTTLCANVLVQNRAFPKIMLNMRCLVFPLVAATIFVYGVDLIPWEIVEVALVSELRDNGQSINDPNIAGHVMKDFRALFRDFGKIYNFRYSKKNFLYNINAAAGKATFAMRKGNCEQLRQFLTVVRAQAYHLKSAELKCGPMKYSMRLKYVNETGDGGDNTTVSSYNLSLDYW
ncbi:unnamed protein product [Cylicocyclus nassatus]|uniref:Uncharacterized protein n=1 Tax=Cylicocyclus nassatus TaxID=53992 RepID=A0AA36M382_CYLNA|nr:unnamed protein product [Cylicocyclus nassatus]